MKDKRKIQPGDVYQCTTDGAMYELQYQVSPGQFMAHCLDCQVPKRAWRISETDIQRLIELRSWELIPQEI